MDSVFGKGGVFVCVHTSAGSSCVPWMLGLGCLMLVNTVPHMYMYMWEGGREGGREGGSSVQCSSCHVVVKYDISPLSHREGEGGREGGEFKGSKERRATVIQCSFVQFLSYIPLEMDERSTVQILMKLDLHT